MNLSGKGVAMQMLSGPSLEKAELIASIQNVDYEIEAPDYRGKPFTFQPKQLNAHIALPRLLHQANQERAQTRRIIEFFLLKSAQNG